MTSPIEKAVELIRRGELVAFPTETVYGLGADCFNAHAVAKIFELKGRPRFDPLIVHVSEAAVLESLILGPLPDVARRLITTFWPGPLTLVLPRRPEVPDIVSAGLPSLAVRCPDQPVALELLRAVGRPLAAPSANRFGKISPTTVAHVRDSFGAEAPLILDGGPCRVGVESTVIDCVGTRPRLLRPGGVPVEDIEVVVGPVDVGAVEASTPLAPGMLKSHYAPTTALRIIDRCPTPPELAGKRVGLLCHTAVANTPLHAACGYEVIRVLSETGDLREAASNLFAALRDLDQLGLDRIDAWHVPPLGLGRAIMDRLARAAARE